MLRGGRDCWRGWRLLDEGEWGELLAEDFLRVAGEPVVEQGGVDLAEVGAEAKVLIEREVEAGRRSVESAFDGVSEHEERSCRAVISAAAAVFVGATSEFGEGHGDDLIEQFGVRQVRLEGGDRLGEFLEQLCVAISLSRMSIEAGVGNVVGSSGLAGGNECGDVSQVAGEAGLRVLD